MCLSLMVQAKEIYDSNNIVDKISNNVVIKLNKLWSLLELFEILCTDSMDKIASDAYAIVYYERRQHFLTIISFVSRQ